jgi:FkbM family methyltransferase
MKILHKIGNKIKLASKVFGLGSDFFEKNKLLFFCFWLPVKKRLGFSSIEPIKVRLRKFNKEFDFYLTDTIEFAILKEIFLDEEYNYDLKENSQIIFDLGSNVGPSVIYFKLKYPVAKIYAFEPNPVAYERLKENTKQFDNIFIFNLAVSYKNGKDKFYIYPTSNLSSSLIERMPDQRYVEVECETLDSLMDRLEIEKIDLLKFDVEGAEFEIFKNFKNIDTVCNLIGEVHTDLMNKPRELFLQIFRDFNVEINELKNQRFTLRAVKDK